MSTSKRKTKGTPDSVDVHVGQRLRVRRSLLGLSQEKLADSIGLTFQQIQKYERGMNRISAGRLYQFSKVLDVPVSYFYDSLGLANSQKLVPGMGDNDQEPFGSDGTSSNVLQTKETIDLIRAYYSIDNPELRKEVIRFIKSMGEATSKNED
jgi:transcriptional regulator with XRE-family HTH domain